MRKRPLMLLACVFLTGLTYQKYSLKVMAGIVLLLLFIEVRHGKQTKNYKKVAGRSIVLLSAFLLGIFRMWYETEFRAAYMSKMIDGSQVTVWGELIKLETVEYGNRGILSECYISLDKEVIPCNDLMVYTSNDQYEVGQIYKITGKVNMFSKARNEGNFDACQYYQSLKIDFAIDEEKTVLLGSVQERWKTALYGLREKMAFVYDRCLSERAAGFYQAMVLGDKTSLENSLKELFLIGGISHILAISGLHISIIGRGVYRFLRSFGIGFAVAGICGGGLIFFYCIMVGASVSTVRAAGMMLIFFLAQWLGRSYDMLNSLGGVVLILLFENPFLLENSGFWFSVTALLGVGVVGKEFSSETEGQRQKRKWFRKCLDGLGMSLGITLATLPVTALSYYEVPLYSPLVNCVLLPLLAPVFLLALLGGLLGVGGIGQGVVTVILQPCGWLLAFYEWFCKKIADFPWASIICGKPAKWQVMIYYSVLLGGVYLLRFRGRDAKTENESRSFKKGVLIVGILFLCCGCILFPKSKEFEITLLDVGQGDGIYMSAGDGTIFFIDGGSSNVNNVGKNRILSFLKAKGVHKVDYWFVSHCDTDHISGLIEVLESGYKIEHIVLAKKSAIDEKETDLIDASDRAGVKVLRMEKGDSICSQNMAITCLAPLEKNGVAIGEDGNENSLVLQVEWKGGADAFKALFAGDISTEIENELWENGVLSDIDLFKANHHGSNYSNGEELLACISPEYIVVSCSKNNLYGHPGELAIERMEAIGAEIFYTMDDGQITVTWDGKTFVLNCFFD